MVRRILYLSALAVIGVGVVALGYEVDRYLYSPIVGSSFPGGSPSAQNAQITEVSGSTRPFPQGGFVVPAAEPGMVVYLTADRATYDWDMHEYGDTCNMNQVEVQDSLRDGWPRWAVSTSDASFLSRYTGDAYPDKGTWVKVACPEVETTPTGFDIKVYEDDKPLVADDPQTTQGYGHLQDSVHMNTQVLVTLNVWHNRDVTYEDTGETPEGPDAYHKLGIWHTSDPQNRMEWLLYNTVDSTYTCVDADRNTSAAYDDNHWVLWGDVGFRYGTGLKTEVVAKIDLVGDNGFRAIPANLLDDLRNVANWSIVQYTREQMNENGVVTSYSPDWEIDGGRPLIDEDPDVTVHIPTSQSDAWIYL
jgi:hypothetical protein